MKRKVAAIDGNGRGLCIEEDIPDLGAGQVLVEVRASLISPGTELGRVKAMRAEPEPARKPRPFGYTNAGIVAEVGVGVTQFRRGERVACMGDGGSPPRVESDPSRGANAGVWLHILGGSDAAPERCGGAQENRLQPAQFGNFLPVVGPARAVGGGCRTPCCNYSPCRLSLCKPIHVLDRVDACRDRLVS